MESNERMLQSNTKGPLDSSLLRHFASSLQQKVTTEQNLLTATISTWFYFVDNSLAKELFYGHRRLSGRSFTLRTKLVSGLNYNAIRIMRKILKTLTSIGQIESKKGREKHQVSYQKSVCK